MGTYSKTKYNKEAHSNINHQISHGLCQECAQKHYPELFSDSYKNNSLDARPSRNKISKQEKGVFEKDSFLYPRLVYPSPLGH